MKQLRSSWLRRPYRPTLHFFSTILDMGQRRFAQRAACGIFRSGQWTSKKPGIKCKRCTAYLSRHRGRR